jgi:Arc/MetJ-type ribon-helix-helix transcriptional regulator
MDIPASIEPLIREHMDSGLYGSVENLLHAALTHLKDDQDEDIEGLRALLQEGLDEIERGETIPAEEVFTELRALQASYQNKSTA